MGYFLNHMFNCSYCVFIYVCMYMNVEREGERFIHIYLFNTILRLPNFFTNLGGLQINKEKHS